MIEELLLRVKADTAQATASIRAFGKQTSDAFDAAGDALAKFNLAVGGAQKIFEGFKEALDLSHFAAEARQVETQFRSLGGSIAEMRGATDGAVSKMDLMRFGLKALQGDLHLTREGMDVVLKAADTLNDQGFGDTIQIAEKLTQALRTGQTRALAEYGIIVDETSTKQEGLNELLGKLQELAANPVQVDESLKSIERIQAATKEWIDDFKRALGDIFSGFVDFSNSVTNLLVGADGGSGRRLSRIRGSAQQGFINKYGQNNIDMALAGAGNVVPVNEEDRLYNEIRKTYDELIATQKAQQAAARQAREEEKLAYAAAMPTSALYQGRAKQEKKKGGGGGGYTLGPSGTQGEWQATYGGAYLDQMGIGSSGDNPFLNEGGDLDALTQKSWGGLTMPADQFKVQSDGYKTVAQAMADYGRQANFTANAVAQLTVGILDNTIAAIESGESIPLAMAKAATGVLKTLALQAASKAIFEVAEGWAALASYRYDSATEHFTSAAFYGKAAAFTGGAAA